MYTNKVHDGRTDCRNVSRGYQLGGSYCRSYGRAVDGSLCRGDGTRGERATEWSTDPDRQYHQGVVQPGVRA